MRCVEASEAESGVVRPRVARLSANESSKELIFYLHSISVRATFIYRILIDIDVLMFKKKGLQNITALRAIIVRRKR